MTKSALRQALLAKRRGATAAEREQWSDSIIRRVLDHPHWKNAHTIGLYLSLPDEVATARLFRQGWQAKQRLFAPRTNLHDATLQFLECLPESVLEIGPLGILQPKAEMSAAPSLDLILVPGVGFDLRGHRLGYGKGFFDRYLAGSSAYTLGLAFDLQVVPELPVDGHDVRLNFIITEKRVIDGTKA